MDAVREASTPMRCALASLPAVAGAYVLAISLTQPVAVTIGGRKTQTLSAGRYLYVGSARGPGGMRARIARHLRRRKPMRWHVDRLTTRGRVVAVWAFANGDECALVGRLRGLPVPLPGFGSSDCDRCRSHLLTWPEGVDLDLGPPTVTMGMAGRPS